MYHFMMAKKSTRLTLLIGWENKISGDGMGLSLVEILAGKT